MNKFANEKDNNNNADVKKNMEQSLENANKSNSKLSLEDEYDFRGEKTRRKIKNIIEKGDIKEWHPKHPLNSTLVPNNIINPMIYRKNKFDLNNVRSFSLQKIAQHKSTNRTNSNINYPKFDIKADPFFPKDIKLKKDFNNYVANGIANHEKPVVHIGDGALCMRHYASGFDNSEDIKFNNILHGLWENYRCKEKICIKYDMAVEKKICVLNEDNKNNLLKLIDEIKIRIDLNDFVFQNKIDSNNFDTKFDELKNKYRGKNISPIAACYFLSAIKKDDLTTERLNKVWNEVNTNLWHSFSIGCDDRLMSLVNNLLDGNFTSDKYLDIFIFCLRLDIRFEWGDKVEDVYNIIYGIITNSEDYKQANGDKKKETAAIKKFFDPNGSFKEFWITLGELNADISPCYKSSYTEILTMRKIEELARNSDNEYSRKLSNLLSDHDIYISPTTEKIKDDKEKEVNQICIKVDSYKQTKENAQNGFNEYMKKLIDDLKNDQNVKYDWAEGTLTYNEKIIYNFKNVKFYDEEGKKYDAADETLQFVARVAKFYCQDHKLPFYGFNLAFFPDNVREIQNIVGEKQQAKIKELIDGFSEFVDKKIEEYGKSKEILFMNDNRLRTKVIDSPDSWSALDKSGVSDAAEACVGRCLDNYWKSKFYRQIRCEEIGLDMYNNLTAKFKRLLNDKIGEYVKNKKLNYEYDEKNNCWKQIAEKSKGNKEINSNEIKENLDKSKAQTFDSSNTNNRNQSETKNKGWIKFLTVLKWIALIGCILALVMTAVSIFVEILAIATIKFAIAAVVLLCVFVLSQLLVSCLSNKKPKENKNPYPKQIYMNLETKENQNEFNINNLVNNESNINQIGEQEKNNVSSIEDSLG